MKSVGKRTVSFRKPGLLIGKLLKESTEIKMLWWDVRHGFKKSEQKAPGRRKWFPRTTRRQNRQLTLREIPSLPPDRKQIKGLQNMTGELECELYIVELLAFFRIDRIETPLNCRTSTLMVQRTITVESEKQYSSLQWPVSGFETAKFSFFVKRYVHQTKSYDMGCHYLCLWCLTEVTWLPIVTSKEL